MPHGYYLRAGFRITLRHPGCRLRLVQGRQQTRIGLGHGVVADDIAALHDEVDTAQSMDVPGRIGLDRIDVGEIAGRDRAENRPLSLCCNAA